MLSAVTAHGRVSHFSNFTGGTENYSDKMGKKKCMKGMVAAMMPGAQVDSKGRVSMNVATSNETLIFNIGGERFETFRSTLYRQPNSPLADDKFLKDHYRPEQGDYFFDRDPNIFRSTLNYLRTGELHIPSYLCGPAAKMELAFWGIQAQKIERCCWTNYNDWNSTLEALNQLEEDRSGSLMDEKMETRQENSSWKRFYRRIGAFLHAPNTSLPAEIYSFVSLFFVVLSIFSFLADTTEGFTVYKNFTVLQPGGAGEFNSSEFSSSESDANTTFAYVSENSTQESNHGLVRVKVTHPALVIIDIVCLAFFTVEYISRVVFAPKRLKYVTSVLGIIDAMAILPDVIEMIVYGVKPELKLDYVVVSILSVLRVIRVLRIFRLILHVPGLWILVYTLKASIGELILLTCFMLVGILIFSSLIYFAEDRENFKSIPHAFWWALITMTTVGYGDMYPVTNLGKLIGSVCALSGLLMVGFSVPALVNNFMLYYKHVRFAIQADRVAKAEEKRQKRKSCSIAPTTSSCKEECNMFISAEKSQNNNAFSESVPLVTFHSNSRDTTNAEV